MQPEPVVTQPVPAPPAALVSAPAPVQRSLLQIAAPSSVTVGQQFSLDIKISDVKDLANAPFVLTYDPIFVDFVAISEGTFMKNDGKPTTFRSVSNSVTGTVSVIAGRAPGNSGVSGGGTLATASFRAKNQGPASFAFRNTAFTAANNPSIRVLTSMGVSASQQSTQSAAGAGV